MTYRKPKADRSGPTFRVPGTSRPPADNPEGRPLLMVMPEYSAFPVWDISGIGPFGWQFMVAPESLPISGHLRGELFAWNVEWENGSIKSMKDWSVRGRRLAQELALDLGGETEVVFYEDRKPAS